MTDAADRTISTQETLAWLAGQDFDKDYPARAWVELVENLHRRGVGALPARTTDRSVGSWVRSVARVGAKRARAESRALKRNGRMRLTPFQELWRYTYTAVEAGLCVPDLLAVDRHVWRDGPLLVTASLGLDSGGGGSLGLASLGRDFPGLGVRSALGWVASTSRAVDADLLGAAAGRTARAVELRATMRDWARVGLLQTGWAAHAAGLTPAEGRDCGLGEEDLLALAALRGTLAWHPAP